MSAHRVELVLAPEDLPRLGRLTILQRGSRSQAAAVLWHDGPGGDLAGRALALSEVRGQWRLERLHPGPGAEWPPCTPAPLLAEAAAQHELGHAMPDDLAPVAGFRGRRHVFQVPASDPSNPDPQMITVLFGQLHGVATERTICRLSLEGDAASLPPLASELARDLRVSVPRASLAQEAACVGRGAALPARHAGPPEVPPHQTVSDSVAQVIGHLLDAMLHWSDQIGAGGSPEPVHQMRVATRRLRSALSIFKHVAAGPELDGLGPALKDCAARLGAARDWDVFLEGAGARLAAAAPDDPRCAAMLRAARRRRTAAYAELRGFLGSPEFRGLQVALGCTATLRPWEAAGDACVLHADTAVFAADVLARRLKRVRTAGRGLAKLPIPALHELRKDCKRLRYAAEFFAPLFAAKPAKRFIQRLSGLQDELGLLNDAAAISGLMAQLGRTGQGYAAGMVAGVAASASQAARDHIGRAWKRFRAAEAFWSA